MKTTRTQKVSIFGIGSNSGNGMNIYLDFSGQHEYLVYHRYNSFLFDLLKDGITIDELRRWRPTKVSAAHGRRRAIDRVRNSRYEGTVTHLLKVIDSYLNERSNDYLYSIEANNLAA